MPSPPPKASSVFPKQKGSVNDFENILSESEEAELTRKIQELESATSDQIVVVTLVSIKPYLTIESYAFDLANDWGVGMEEKDKGIVIALGKELKQIRIENSMGIQQRLTDSEAKRIIEELMIPEFKQENYYKALLKGIEAISLQLK
ncbi:TLP18.3/Psb32/MOLO-1 phosphatase superfamily protein [Leeuwenhoekiella polynyae]|uniref:TLP18.3/Psb32/MOLO-1 phosphatase superfamily protein n=2 Tax=Leeuwenhoekiella polynyae TaxID=1550906 RepID=A0A4Q0NX07_9FLAO|nr:TLP18.3/Psb32/MOLO-1 phosphatase superfamily protein [Leeuwenhoekiella polynyae]